MLDLKRLVQNGIFDKRTQQNIAVRVIAHLGDNLEQHEGIFFDHMGKNLFKYILGSFTNYVDKRV